jgi:hypothetical protein
MDADDLSPQTALAAQNLVVSATRNARGEPGVMLVLLWALRK